MIRQLLKELVEALDIRVSILTKEEAAKEILSREVKFKWAPTIIEFME